MLPEPDVRDFPSCHGYVSARKERHLVERIRGIRAANPPMPAREIAAYVGVSTRFARGALEEPRGWLS